MYKNVVTDIFFDLDHTLWDFEKNSALTFEKILKKHQVAVALDVFLEHYVPINFEYWRLFRDDKITKEELRYLRLKVTFDRLELVVEDSVIHELSEDYIHYLSSFNYLFDGAIEILDYLKPNYKLHIITNGFEEVQEKKMAASGILHYFETVVNSEMAGVKKPNPKIFHLSLEKANALPEKSIMIGDSLEADVLGAKNVGMHALHFVTMGEETPMNIEVIQHLGQIKNYL